MEKDKARIGLGVAWFKGKILLLYKYLRQSGLALDESQDGLSFSSFKKPAKILTEGGRSESISNCSDFRVSEENKVYILTYLKNLKKPVLKMAYSLDFKNFKSYGTVSNISECAVLVPGYEYKGKVVLYSADKSIRLASSYDYKNWKSEGVVVKGGESYLKVATSTLLKEGILLLCFKSPDKKSGYEIEATLFDRGNPKRLLWESPKVIWKQGGHFGEQEVNPLGAVIFDKRLISYWQTSNGNLYALNHPNFGLIIDDTKPSFFYPTIKKLNENPILKPMLENFWESKAVFNAAAVYDEGKVHLLYRAVGDKDVSVLGYAVSTDGVNIDERLTHPVYIPTEGFEGSSGKLFSKLSPFVSGPGYGGVEDPRITKIDDRFYMIYVAFDGGNPPRLALTSISAEDFHKKVWSWEKPVLISPPGVVDKSGCILPEKVGGKYVIFHRVFPNILIDFVDSLDFKDGYSLRGESIISPRSDNWDSRKVGIGPTPLKTDDGWLVIYNAVDNKDDSRYKMGAMLLDLSDPTRVLYRSGAPILEPTEHYENGGLKYGVIYPCGAVIVKGKLIVYYGGSDTYLCAAQANLNNFLEDLKDTGYAQLAPLDFREPSRKETTAAQILVN